MLLACALRLAPAPSNRASCRRHSRRLHTWLRRIPVVATARQDRGGTQLATGRALRDYVQIINQRSCRSQHSITSWQGALTLARNNARAMAARRGACQTRLSAALPVQQATEVRIQSVQALRQACAGTRALGMPALVTAWWNLRTLVAPMMGALVPSLTNCPKQTLWHLGFNHARSQWLAMFDCNGHSSLCWGQSRLFGVCGAATDP